MQIKLYYTQIKKNRKFFVKKDVCLVLFGMLFIVFQINDNFYLL